MKKDLKSLIIQLSELTDSELSFNEAITLLEHPWKDQLNRHINAGLDLAVFLKDKGLNSDQLTLLINLERSGMTSQALKLIAENEQTASNLKKELVSTLAYPLFVIICCFLVLIFFEYLLLPSFTSVFNTMNIEPPRIILFLKALKYLPLLCLLLYLFLKILKIDLFASLNKELRNIQVLKQVQSALENNYPIAEVFKQLKDLQFIIFYLNRGAPLSLSLEKGGLLRQTEILQLRNAEKGNNLLKRLKMIIERKRERYFKKMKKLVMFIEPAAIIFTGGVVGLICLTIMAPLINLSGNLGF